MASRKVKIPPRKRGGGSTIPSFKRKKGQVTNVARSIAHPEAAKALLALEKNQCRYPIDIPNSTDYTFCGKETDGCVYCVYHELIAFQEKRILRSV